MKRPIKEWFELIADPTIREKALKNYDPNFKSDSQEVDSLFLAFENGFNWFTSPEGGSYWGDIAVDAKEGEIKLLNPKDSSQLKVGDVIPVEVLNKWCRSGDNEKIGLSYWTTATKDWCSGDKTVEWIGTIENVPAFSLKCHPSIHIKLEGFYEFWKSFENGTPNIKETPRVEKIKGASGEEFEIGKCYVSPYLHVPNIVKITDAEGYYPTLTPSLPNFKLKEPWHFSASGWREATKEETDWLEACIAAGKFVENPNTIPTTLESYEDLVAEARRRYPIGTKYVCAGPSITGLLSYTVESYEWEESGKPDIIYGECTKGCLYHKGKWAKIISQPKEEKPLKEKGKTPLEICKEKYKPGMTIKPVDCYGKLIEGEAITVPNGDFCTNEITTYGMLIWKDYHVGLLYANGKYAEIVEQPNQSKQDTITISNGKNTEIVEFPKKNSEAEARDDRFINVNPSDLNFDFSYSDSNSKNTNSFEPDLQYVLKKSQKQKRKLLDNKVIKINTIKINTIKTTLKTTKS